MSTWLICGGRDVAGADVHGVELAAAQLNYVVAKLDSLYDVLATPDLVVHGGARGADTLAGKWAEGRGIPVRVYPADWNRYGKGAGPKRNQQMLDEADPDVVIAFFDLPFAVSKGTADMVTRAGNGTRMVLSYDVPRSL